MELHVLRNFLTVAREQNISRAARILHISQPALSVQLKNLEEELGRTLLVRGSKGSRRVGLTEEGMLFRRRAEQIVTLLDKTRDEIQGADGELSGQLTIGACESKLVRYLTRAQRLLQTEHPALRFGMISGDKLAVLEALENGVIDFGMVFGGVDPNIYEQLPVPAADVWGVYIPPAHPLAAQESIRREDLQDHPLLLSRQGLHENALGDWFGPEADQLAEAGSYSLIYNGALMAEEGMGLLLGLDSLLQTMNSPQLVFRPLEPACTIQPFIVWKKYQVLSRAARAFLEVLKDMLESEAPRQNEPQTA